MEKLGEGQGIVYLTVRDKKAMPLGNAGELPPERTKEDPLFPKILAGAVTFESRKVSFGWSRLSFWMAQRPVRVAVCWL